IAITVAADIWTIDFISNLDAFNGIPYRFNIMLFTNQHFCQITQMNGLAVPIPYFAGNGKRLLMTVNGPRYLPHVSIAVAQIAQVCGFAFAVSNFTVNSECLLAVVNSPR